MGAVRKIGMIILAYLVLGVIFSILILTDIISIHDGNIVVVVLFWIFRPVVYVTNILYATFPFSF